MDRNIFFPCSFVSKHIKGAQRLAEGKTYLKILCFIRDIIFFSLFIPLLLASS